MIVAFASQQAQLHSSSGYGGKSISAPLAHILPPHRFALRMPTSHNPVSRLVLWFGV
jgi:hypothetical protein